MPFELTEEQIDIYKAAKEWAQGKFDKEGWDADRIKEQEKKHEFPRELFNEACQLGFFGAWIPEKYGGQGLGVLDRCVIAEALCSVDPMFGFLDAGLFGAEAIYLGGSEEQKEKYLSRVAKGDIVFACGFTEPSGGTDVAGARTTAVREGDEYVINGEKVFNSNAGHADIDVVLCRTTPLEKVKKRYHGLSQIIVPCDAKGFSAEIVEKMGINYAPTHNVAFQDVRVPVENLIGKEGQGFYQSMQFFDFTRPWIGAMGVGFAQCALDLAVDYSKERELFEQKLATFQGHQFRLAEMEKKILTARYLVYTAAYLVDKEKSNPILSSAAKWNACEMCQHVVDEALLIYGGYGYTTDYRLERLFRDAKVLEIVEGTKEAEKTAIARELLR